VAKSAESENPDLTSMDALLYSTYMDRDFKTDDFQMEICVREAELYSWTLRPYLNHALVTLSL
jgi:hypothetical protein